MIEDLYQSFYSQQLTSKKAHFLNLSRILSQIKKFLDGFYTNS